MSSDVIHDTLDAILSLLREQGIHPEPIIRAQAEAKVRHVWGGERPYIGRTHAIGLQQMSARDKEILRRWSRGEHLAFLARHFHLSESRIRQILAQQRGDTAAVCLIGCDSAGDAVEHVDSQPAAEPPRRRQPKQNIRAA